MKNKRTKAVRDVMKDVKGNTGPKQIKKIDRKAKILTKKLMK
jgi:hypothetical protein